MENLMKREKKTKGITLIALIITIIVMLILVAVSLTIAMQTGLFDTAGKATQKWKTEQEKEADLKVNIAGMEYDSVDKYVDSLTVQIPWIYEENENGDIEITGINFKEYSFTNPAGEEGRYTINVNIGTETLIIPDKLEEKNVVKVSFSESIIPTDADPLGMVYVKDVKRIVVGEHVVDFSCSGVSFAAILETIDLPEGLTTIGDFTFYSKLKLNIPASVTYVPTVNISIGISESEIGTFKNVPEVNFPNGMNEAITIPDNLWGAKKLTIEGVEYVPGS